MPISSKELYERLKKREVLIVSGHYFFFGDDDLAAWPHRHECIRMTFTMDERTVHEGIKIIAEEVARAYADA